MPNRVVSHIRSISRVVSSIHDYLTDAGLIVGLISLVIITGSYCREVVGRYFFNAPSVWANEIVTLMLLVSIFSTLPHVTRRSQHIAVNILEELLPVSRRTLQFATSLAGASVCVFAAIIIWQQLLNQYATEVQLVGNISLKRWLLTSVILFGFSMSAIWFFRTSFSRESFHPRMKLLREID